MFVGRRRELAILERKLDTALAGQGGLLMLAGEAGIGKTRLAGEFVGYARQRGVTVLQGSCLEAEWQPPYGPWAEALGGYVRGRDPEPLRREMGAGAVALAQVVPEARGTLPDTAAAAPLSPEQERLRLYDAVAQFLLVVAKENALLLVLDDLQWADADSLRLLRYVSRFLGRARLLLLGVYRDPDTGLDARHPLQDTLALIRREGGLEQVVVRGLGGEEVAEYLAQATGQPPPEALARTLHVETAGNPFYLQELFRHLREEGKLLRNGERWAADLSPGEMGIPEGVRQVVARRVARITAETSGMLSLASGFAGDFEFPVLQALTGLPEEALLDCLDEALGAGILRVARSIPPAYAFSHSIVRHSLYGRMNPDRRSRLHRRIATALEQVYAGREIDHAAELASQYRSSPNLPGAARGIRYALAAAEQARVRYAFDQAASFLQVALDLSAESDPRTRADLLCQLAVAQAELLLLEEARTSAQEALAALSEAGAEPAAQAQFLARMARALKDAGAGSSHWAPLVERGLELMGDRRDLLWARLTLLRDRFEPVSQGSITYGRWLGHDPGAVAIARRHGDEEDYAHTLDSLEWPTRQETEATLQLARSWRRPSAVMAGLSKAARDLFYRHGAFQEVAHLYGESLAAAERYGSIPEQAEALAYLAVTRAVLGDLAGARETAQRASEMIGRLGPAHVLHFVHAALGAMLAYYLEGDWTEMAAAADRFSAGLETAFAPYRTYEVGLAAAAITAFAQARAGNRAESLRRLAVLTPVATAEGPMAFAQNTVVSVGAATVWELGAVEFAGSFRDLGIELIAAGVGNSPLGPHQLAVARMAALQEDMAGARERFDQARRIAEAQGLRPARAVADYDEAWGLLRSGSTDHTRISDLLEAAQGEFRALSMESWVNRALALRQGVATSSQSRPEVASPPVAAKQEGEPWRGLTPLTPREREVAALLADGLSNAEIAARLVISIRTAEAHVANILGKLGFSSRAQAAAWAAKQNLTPPT